MDAEEVPVSLRSLNGLHSVRFTLIFMAICRKMYDVLPRSEEMLLLRRDQYNQSATKDTSHFINRLLLIVKTIEMCSDDIFL